MVELTPYVCGLHPIFQNLSLTPLSSSVTGYDNPYSLLNATLLGLACKNGLKMTTRIWVGGCGNNIIIFNKCGTVTSHVSVVHFLKPGPSSGIEIRSKLDCGKLYINTVACPILMVPMAYLAPNQNQNLPIHTICLPSERGLGAPLIGINIISWLCFNIITANNIQNCHQH